MSTPKPITSSGSFGQNWIDQNNSGGVVNGVMLQHFLIFSLKLRDFEDLPSKCRNDLFLKAFIFQLYDKT